MAATYRGQPVHVHRTGKTIVKLTRRDLIELTHVGRSANVGLTVMFRNHRATVFLSIQVLDRILLHVAVQSCVVVTSHRLNQLHESI